MDIRRALTYLFHDPDWVGKLGVAMVLSLLPLGLGKLAPGAAPTTGILTLDGQAASFLRGAVLALASVPVHGFVLRITRQVVTGSDVPLPAWSDISGILRDGLKLWAVYTCWWNLPLTLIGATTTVLRSGMVRTSRASPALALITAIVALLVLAVILFVAPAAVARLAATGSVAAGLDAPATFRMVGSHLGAYVRLGLVTVAGALLGFGVVIGLVALCWRALDGQSSTRDVSTVGTYVTVAVLGPYGQFVLAHLLGQVYAASAHHP